MTIPSLPIGEDGIIAYYERCGLFEGPGGTLGSVFDGDSGCAQGITNGVGAGEILGLAGFGTLLQLFGNQTVKRSML